MLEKTEVAIKNWQSRETSNIGHARRTQTLGTQDEHKHWARKTNKNIGHTRRTQTLGTQDEHKYWARTTNTNSGHARRTQTLGTQDEHKHWARTTNTNKTNNVHNDICWTPLYSTFFLWLHITSIVNISNINLKKKSYWV
jgi:hypothetical protein